MNRLFSNGFILQTHIVANKRKKILTKSVKRTISYLGHPLHILCIYKKNTHSFFFTVSPLMFAVFISIQAKMFPFALSHQFHSATEKLSRWPFLFSLSATCAPLELVFANGKTSLSFDAMSVRLH